MRGKPFLFISIFACLVIFSACAPSIVPSTGSGSGSAQPSATTPPEPSFTPAPSQPSASGDVTSIPQVSTTIPGSGSGVVVGVTSGSVTEVPPMQGGGIGPGAFITPGPDGNLSVTLDDQGKTVRLKVGERFLLNLGEGYDWSPEVADQSVVSRVRNIAVIRGAQGIYEALAPGTTTLNVSGDPTCRQSTPPCGMPSRMFTITIEVN